MILIQDSPANADIAMEDIAEDLVSDFGINLIEGEIDEIIFKTNQFVTSSTFTGANGPFFHILEICLCLAAMFALIVGANMAYKMMYKGEPLDVLKLLRPLAISIILCLWYPGNRNTSVLDVLAYIPNAIGAYTRDLYNAEATQVNESFERSRVLIKKRDTMYEDQNATMETAKKGVENADITKATAGSNANAAIEQQNNTNKAWFTTMSAGAIVMLDKIIMVIALICYRIGWWATIYCQQIVLGMLTIFGPIQWAFSLLPKWEGAWAKWMVRYLTVHFYGAMLYFVGFYVLLLFDIVLNIQISDLEAVTTSTESFVGYIKNCFFSAGYLMAASIVALKCLNLVPDLAAWMIPEGDTTFATRNFGEGIASQAKASATGMMKGIGM